MDEGSRAVDDLSPLGDGSPDEPGFAAGAIPAPETLARYNAIVPGSAVRILNMAEEQARHRYKLEQALAEAGVRRARQAIDSGTAVAVICIVAGFLLVVSGQPVPGVAVAALGVALFVGVFLYAVGGRWPRRRPLPPAPAARGPHGFDLLGPHVVPYIVLRTLYFGGGRVWTRIFVIAAALPGPSIWPCRRATSPRA